MNKKNKNREVRSLDGQMHLVDDSRTIEGYAVVFNSRSNELWSFGDGVFTEVIERGAISSELVARSDVKALLYHNHERILARSKEGSGSLTLEVDEKGLKYRFTAPNTADGDTALELVKRGDISGSSFAFTVARGGSRVEESEDGTVLRTITKISGLYDITLTPDPAYSDTSVAVREMQARAQVEEPEEPTAPRSVEPQRRAKDILFNSFIAMNDKEKLLQKREMLRTLEEERKQGKLTEERAKEYDSLLAEVETLTRSVRYEELTRQKPKKQDEETSELREMLKRSVEARESRQAQSVELRAGEVTKTPDISAVTPSLFQQVMQPLHEAYILNKVGGRMLTGVVGEPIFPIMSALEAQFAGEAVELSAKKVSLSALKMSPKRIGISVDASSQSIHQSNVGLPQQILTAIGIGVSNTLHQWIFGGKTVGGAGDSVMKPVLDSATQYDPKTETNLKLVVDLEAKVLAENFVPSQMRGAYVVGTKAYCNLKSTPVEKGNPKMLIEDGTMNGYPVIVSNFIAQDAIIFGCWDYLASAQFGTPRLVIDPISQANRDVVRFTLNTDVDAKLLMPKAFAAVKPKAGI